MDLTSTVPDEILAEIFTAGRHPIDCSVPPSNALSRMAGRVPGTPMLFNIIAVCRRWKSIAISTPALWSYLFLRPISDGHRDVAEAFLKMCLVRSGSHPLNMMVGEPPRYDQLTNIIATSERWQTLRINDGELSIAVKSEAFKGLAELRYLDILACTSRNTPSGSTDQIRLELPNLVTLFLRIASNTAVCLPLKLSIPNVTHVSLDLFAWEQGLAEIASLLSSLPRLSHLDLVCMPGPIILLPSFHSWVFNLPHLQKLALRSGTQLSWTILSRCRMPSLTHLCIEANRVGWEWINDIQIASALALFVDHCPQLESFKAQSVGFAAFMKVLLKARPRFVAFGEEADEHTIQSEISSLLTQLVDGEHTMEWIEQFALYDGRMSNDGVSHADDLIAHLLRTARCHEKLDPVPVPRQIDIHSSRPISDYNKHQLQYLFEAGLIPPSPKIQLHSNGGGGGNLRGCQVPHDQWHYPYSPTSM